MAQFNEIPKFQLTRVFSNGTSQAPELYALDGINAACRMERRGFLMTSAFSAGALASLSACDGLVRPVTPSGESCADNSARKRENSQRWKGEPMAAPQGVITDPNDDSLRAHSGRISGLSFSRDGKLLASVCLESDPTLREHNKIKIWSIESAELLQTIAPPEVGLIAFSPHDDYLVIGNDRTKIRRISADAKPPVGKAIAVGPEGYVPFRLRMSGNGRRMVTEDIYKIRVLDLPQGNLVRDFTTFGSRDIALNFDGSMLAVDGRCEALTVYSVSSGEPLFRWDVPLWSVDFSADGKLLVGRDMTQLVWWDVPSGNFRKSLLVPSAAHSGLEVMRFCPNGKWLAVSSREQEQDDILVFRAPYGAAVWRLRSSVPNGSAIAFSPDSRWLATGSLKGHVTLWDLENGELPRRLVDIAAVTKNDSIRVMEIHGRKEYVGKCGDPLPPGAICTCNCVPGTFSPPDQPKPRTTPSRRPTWGGVETCTCDQICTCVPIK